MCALQRRIGHKTAISVYAGGSSTGTESALGNVVNLTGPDVSSDDVDISLLSDTFKQFARAQVDPGTVTITIAQDPNDVDTTIFATLLSQGHTPLPRWVIKYPVYASTTETRPERWFDGYVNGLSDTYEKDSLLMTECSIKLSGDPNYPST